MNAFFAGKCRSQFYDAVNMIHDVIRTANPFTFTDKLTFVGGTNNKTPQIRPLTI